MRNLPIAAERLPHRRWRFRNACPSVLSGVESRPWFASRGIVTKIEDNKITVKNAAGKETTIKVKITANIKVGYRVIVKDGEVTKERPRRVIEGC
jgi:hypothetical protein